jgi:protein-tyrosine-phosphatase
MTPFNVLFLCTGNSARSIMAEAILNDLGEPRFKGWSAGSNPRGELHPQTVALLERHGFDTRRFNSKSWDLFAKPDAPHLDFVFTVCDRAASERCPTWPKEPMNAHWGVPDPAAIEGNPAEVALAFNEAWALLRRRIEAFVNLPFDSLDRAWLREYIVAIGRLAHERRKGGGRVEGDAADAGREADRMRPNPLPR